MAESKTFQINNDVKQSGTIQFLLNITWTGNLTAALLQWTSNGTVIGAGLMGIIVKVNGIQLFQDPDQLVIAGITGFSETPQSLNIPSALIQGNNVIEFDVIQTSGGIATEDFAVLGSLTITSDGTITIVPPPLTTPTDWTTIAIIAIAVIVIALAAGLFFRAKGTARVFGRRK